MDFAYDEADAAVGNNAGNSGNGVACHPFVFYASLGCNRNFFSFQIKKIDISLMDVVCCWM